MISIDEYLLAKPNWASPVLYRRKWQTCILPSINGEEQRSSLLTWPRRTLAYTALSSGFTESALILRKLYRSLHLVWGVPFWQDRTTLTAQAVSGQKILQVRSTENRNFEEGGTCIVLDPNNLASYEAGVVDTFGAASITLEVNLSSTWPAGREVYPVLKARIKSGQSWDPIASRMGQVEIEAFEEYDSGVTWVIGASPYSDYLGHPLFDRLPHSANREMKFIRPYDRLSFIGETYSMTDVQEAVLNLSTSHLSDSKAEIQKILDLFDSQKGRWGSFWVPTWREDVRITAPFGAGDSTLTVENVEFASYWLNKDVGAYITILWPDGDRAVARVLAAPTTTSITLDAAIGKACSEGERRRLLCSFLLFCRFDHDEIKITYHTDSVAETTLSFQSLLGEIPGIDS